MSGKKNTHLKKTKARTSSKTKETVDEETIDPRATLKPKKPVEIDLIEETVAIEEKSDEESPLADELEDVADEAVLDDEELNPFGDKWEQ